MRDVAHYLEDMLEAIDRIETYTSGFKQESILRSFTMPCSEISS